MMFVYNYTTTYKNVESLAEKALDDLYNVLSDKTRKEKDAIIDLVCDLCRLHQQSGFIAGLKLAHSLSQELNT